MHVVLVHDPMTLPVDLYAALAEAGHRVASHGGDLDALPVFLEAIRARPDAFVVDFRGDAARALGVAAWLRARVPATRLVLVHVPDGLAAAAAEAAPSAVVASADGVAGALAGA